jgi:succinyl-diaminopimelate desuccinylase
VTSSPGSGPSSLGDRLAARTLAMVDVPSVSRDEAALLSAIRASLPPGYDVVDDGDAVLFAAPSLRRPEVPFIVLAGHVDTVPLGGAAPPALGGGAVIGRGASDMKGALAVMLELARELPGSDASADVGLLFFGREELPFDESAVQPFFARCALASTIDLAVVMEPTDNELELGCLGNLNVNVTVRGRAAHSARPWQGENAIHRAVTALAPLVDLPARDVEVEGLTFREVISVTTIDGGIATNVVPDLVRAHVNYRYAPGHAPDAAEARLRELLSVVPVELTVIGNAPPAPVEASHPSVQALRRAGDLTVRPKQAWTPVAEFALAGVPAVNFGPGDPQYAHRDDERVEVGSLVRCQEVLRAFLGLPAGTRP